MNADTIKTAETIALRDLSRCTTDDGIIAGAHHFVDLWARDSLFAAFGAPEAVTKKTLETFFRFQRADGAIPYRIFRRGFLFPNFRSVQSGGFVPDGGLMAVIAAGRLHDGAFLKKHGRALEKILSFYKKRYGDGLITEWFQCEWADAVLKSGKTLYTNVLYWAATRDPRIAEKINDTFWTGRYFRDWVDTGRQNYFAAHPNMLAIVLGMASQKQSSSILDFARRYCWNGWTLEENYPEYPWWRIPVQNYLAGIPDYHNRGCLWLQPGILYALALHRHRKRKEANDVLTAVSRKITEYNGVFEVYEKNGRPVRRLLYRSEGPFAWSAGLFLFAAREIGGNKKIEIPQDGYRQKTRYDKRKKSLRAGK